jgi:hypothetical protein
MADTFRCLEVRRDDLRTHRIVTGPVPEAGPDEVLLRVDRFALTANNVTYAVAGDMIGYWRFFPAADAATDPGWGRIPVWGFADVEHSSTAGLAPGTRVFGYLPMATHLVVQPGRVSPAGFNDLAAHRSALPAAYNGYRIATADPAYRRESEDHQMVLWPLFMTSFILDDFLADNADFGARTLILASASSKTAAGTAFCVSRRPGPRPEVVGLTSSANLAFVEGLGCYDRVLTYDAVTMLDPSATAVFVDMAGNPAVRAAVHGHYDDHLRYSCAVGITHWEQFGATGNASEPLPGPAPQMFFAPAQIEKRSAEWGAAGFQERFGAAWSALREVVDEWLTLVESVGPEEAAATYLEVLSGTARPDIGHVVTLHPAS